MEQRSAAIHTEALTKRFGSFVAVDAVTFEVRDGEAFGLLGPNGAGKTTLIRMLTTLLPPTSGRAIVAGYDVAQNPHSVRESIGVIPQALTSDLDLTGWENLDIDGEFYGQTRHQRRERAVYLLDLVALTDRAKDLVATYSGGMRRRLEIARGLMHEPKVLFLDEPTIGLDPQSRRAVWELLEHLRRETSLTISLTTHYMEEADALCDRIAIVDGGKIVALDTPGALKAGLASADRIELEVDGEAERIAEVLRAEPYVRELTCDGQGRISVATHDGARAIPRLVDRVEANGRKVVLINLHSVTLEDVFIHFTGRTLRESAAPKVSMLDMGLPRGTRI
ncbi:MAG: ATP-binding cassette domain-containing protein [Candidatus Binataceae bacterium]